ncbi:hypothetical protein LTR08_001900 [Meristemomyces frigidus]|nr:hypothetical protein LTR08_001900 [Meristemomyces frigidus]
MPSFASLLTLLAISLLGFANYAVCMDSDQTPSAIPATPAAVFQDSGPSIDGQFVFALSAYQPNSTSNTTADLYLYMSAPSVYQWMGVGIGRSMGDAVMWIAYPSQNGTGLTLSVRLSHGQREPDFQAQAFGCEQIWGDDLADGNTVTNDVNGTMTLNAVCRGAAAWNSSAAVTPGLQNAIDAFIYTVGAQNTNNNFIYAVGPRYGYGDRGSRKLRSDSPQAGLSMHGYHGSFTMQTEQAVTNDSNAAGIPQFNGANSSQWITENASSPSATKEDFVFDLVPAMHGVVMCLTFVIVFPLGALVLRVLQRVILHAVVQAVGFVLVCIATAGGIVLSTRYHWSIGLLTAHQVVGVLVFIALAAQLGLGIVHHRIFKNQKRPTIMGKIHKYLGPTTIVAGVINAPLGLFLADKSHLVVAYVGVLIAIALILIGISELRKRQQKATGAAPAGSEGYRYSQFGHEPDQGQKFDEHLGGPPAYGKSQSYKNNDGPLRLYESQQSGWAQEPAHPRPMV